MSGIDRRNLIRALVQTRIGPSPRARKQKWRRADRAVRKSLGHCVDCNGQRVPGISRCSPCKSRHDAWGHASYDQRIEAGLCSCGAKVTPGRTQCPACAERNRLGARARRAARREGR